ncbi:MAG: hypothetical protein AB7P99_07035 [Vicinamibacterales bacterium]
MLVEHAPGRGTTVRVSRGVAVNAAHHDIMLAFLDHWLGTQPVSEEMKRTLLGRNRSSAATFPQLRGASFERRAWAGWRLRPPGRRFAKPEIVRSDSSSDFLPARSSSRESARTFCA